VTLYDLAQRFIGEVVERPGDVHHPFILWCHESVAGGFRTDEIPWCSSFLNRLAWLLRLPRSKSAAARSWLTVGEAVQLNQARPGDVVILKRGQAPQPGPEVLDAPGHVCLYAGRSQAAGTFQGLGGNQADGVTVAAFKTADVLGVRRIYDTSV
jgi:uncharacterized protein (TIGR02594 family)